MTIEIDELSDLDATWLSYTKSLIAEPDDFTKWVEFITYTERLHGGIVKNSSNQDKYLLFKAYENLLTQWPCLELFWCDLAKWHFRLGYTEDCLGAYHRALEVLPNSLIVWLEYFNFIQFYKSGDPEFVLAEFEKARCKIGLHYYGGKFYDIYLSFLQKNNRIKEYYILLRRILEIPLYDYSKYFSKWFKAIEDAGAHDMSYIISAKDLHNKYQYSVKDLNISKHLQDLKVKLKKLFIDLYITTQYHSYQLYQYEKNLFHQFFHPSNSAGDEVNSWVEYFVYQETLLLNHSNTKDKLNYQIQLQYVNSLYERCLLIHPNVSKVWLKYANFQVSINNVQGAIDICQRSFRYTMTDLDINSKLVDLYVLSKDYKKAQSTALNLYKLYPNKISVFVNLLICEKLIGENDKKLGDHLIELVTKKVSKTSNVIFDYLFQELEEFKIVSPVKFKTLIASFKDTKKSAVYWATLLDFIEINFGDELEDFLALAKENCDESNELPSRFRAKFGDVEKHTWLNMF